MHPRRQTAGALKRRKHRFTREEFILSAQPGQADIVFDRTRKIRQLFGQLRLAAERRGAVRKLSVRNRIKCRTHADRRKQTPDIASVRTTQMNRRASDKLAAQSGGAFNKPANAIDALNRRRRRQPQPSDAHRIDQFTGEIRMVDQEMQTADELAKRILQQKIRVTANPRYQATKIPIPAFIFNQGDQPDGPIAKFSAYYRTEPRIASRPIIRRRTVQIVNISKRQMRVPGPHGAVNQRLNRHSPPQQRITATNAQRSNDAALAVSITVTNRQLPTPNRPPLSFR